MIKKLCLLPFLFITLIANAQLVITSELDFNEMDVVTLHKGFIIRNVHDAFYLCLKTDNEFEDHYATLFLGEDKESALKTLDDLIQLPVDKNKYIYSFGINGAKTSIRKMSFMGVAGIFIKTDGVTGEACGTVSHIKKAKKMLENGEKECPKYEF